MNRRGRETAALVAAFVLCCLALAWMGAPVDETRAGEPVPEPIVPRVSLGSLLAAEASAVRAPGASPAGHEAGRGSAAVEATVEGDAGDTTPGDSHAPSTAPHLLTVTPEVEVTATLPAPTATKATPPALDHAALARTEFLALLAETSWPPERYGEVLRVACGPGVRAWDGLPLPRGESGCEPWRVGAYGEHGLLQLMPEWAAMCGVRPEDLFDPLTNLECAYHVEAYGQEVRGEAWTWWSVRPW